MATVPVFLPGELLEQRSLAGYSPWGRKEMDTTEQLHSHIVKLVYARFREAGVQAVEQTSPPHAPSSGTGLFDAFLFSLVT